jgi:hypothetical protein
MIHRNKATRAMQVTSRWQNKVVDAPSPFRANNESHKRHVESSNKYSSFDEQLPGPSMSAPHTPTRRGPGAFACACAASPASAARRSASPGASAPSGMSFMQGEERVERYSRRVASPQRAPSPATNELYSRRMSPRRYEVTSEASLDRPLSAAKSDVLMDRGRMHSPSHRNLVDNVGRHLSGSTAAGAALGVVAATAVIRMTSLENASSGASPTPSSARPSSRPCLKNVESARLEASHWKPVISKRCVTSQPSLVGVMKPDAAPAAAPYRLVPPFGVSRDVDA